MVVVDGSGKHAFGQISDCGGRRLLIALDNLDVLSLKDGDSVRVGIVEVIDFESTTKLRPRGGHLQRQVLAAFVSA
ncbi:MAG: hypothetical protein U0892_13745 [Pirellulales bacterium]